MNLNMSWNSLTGKRVFYLLDAVKKSKSLLNLNLAKNLIGDGLNSKISVGMYENEINEGTNAHIQMLNSNINNSINDAM